MLEKDSLPHSKPCAGGIALSTLSLFPFCFEEAVDCHVANVCYSLAGRFATTVALPKDAVATIDRQKLDIEILRNSRGAAVFDNTALVRVSESSEGVIVDTSDGRTFFARLGYFIASFFIHKISHWC